MSVSVHGINVELCFAHDVSVLLCSDASGASDGGGGVTAGPNAQGPLMSGPTP